MHNEDLGSCLEQVKKKVNGIEQVLVRAHIVLIRAPQYKGHFDFRFCNIIGDKLTLS